MLAVALQGSIASRFVSSRSGGFEDRDGLTFAPFVDGDVQLSVAKTVTGNMQVDVYGLPHGHVRFIVRLPLMIVDHVDVRVSWSPIDVKLFIDNQQVDQWRVRARAT
jgi:hypothetical protein